MHGIDWVWVGLERVACVCPVYINYVTVLCN